MTNAERYKDLLRKLYNSKERWAIEKDTNKFAPCGEMGCSNCVLYDLSEEDHNYYIGCSHARTKWMLAEYEEPITLTELEYKILKFIADNTNNIYIARDMKGSLFLYEQEPKKDIDANFWIGRGVTPLTAFDKLFRFVTWEDKEPYSIKEILKHCRVIGDNVVMHEVG